MPMRKRRQVFRRVPRTLWRHIIVKLLALAEVGPERAPELLSTVHLVRQGICEIVMNVKMVCRRSRRRAERHDMTRGHRCTKATVRVPAVWVPLEERVVRASTRPQ